MKRKKLRFYVCFFLYQTAILIQLYIHFHFPEDSYGGALHLLIFAAVTVVVFTYFPLVKEIHHTTKLEAELTILERQQFLRQRQSQALLQRQKETLDFQTQIASQLRQVQSCLREKDYEQAVHGCKDLSQNFQKIRFRPCCSDSLISAILDSKKQAAAAHGISVDYQILLPQKAEFFPAALSSVFFNLLDNGTEACLRRNQPRSFLRMETKVSGGFLMIRMCNSKSPHETFSRETQKKDSASHGYGLAIIEEIAEKNDGFCEWTDHGDTFESVVALRLSAFFESVQQ